MHRIRHDYRRLISFATIAIVTSIIAQAAEYDPPIAPASDEGEKAMSRFALQDGFEIELFAAEPMLANPVCFYIDHQGRAYVAETFRLHHGVTDMRSHRDWLDDDLASRNNEERLITMKKNLGADFARYTEAEDRVRLIEDLDGDGRADHATVFADGFKDALAGIGAGLLVDRGEVYWACIPELWKLRDRDGDGVAEEREVLSSGYGVHINFLGHDLHGLRKGPDGRIYFSIGDRGLYIKTFDGRILDEPDTGCVLRCNPDGTNLEIVHRGLRNPQELVFDDYGNLFTGDNNSDGGDQARWVYIAEGGDSGWRIGYQWISKPNPRGQWNAEKMWHPYHEGQPAHLLPPLINLGAGPSGLAYYPGTGLPDRYKKHFFLCDFRGAANMSLIHAFRVEPKGASFDVVGRHDFMNHALATDVDFGVEGGLYFSDWVQGWDQPLKGRIYRVFDPSNVDQTLIEDTKRLLAEGMADRYEPELVSLLDHADQRVRFEAQYALADKGTDAIPIFTARANDPSGHLARLHSIWGLWQLALAGKHVAESLTPLLNDNDAEVRAQAAKAWAELPDEDGTKLVQLLDDENDRVKFFAAIGLWKNPPKNRKRAFDGVVEMLHKNDGADPYLRHAGVLGLLGCGDGAAIEMLSDDESEAVRLGALLALRRLQRSSVDLFLNDESDILFSEAIRAINDAPIPEAYSALARTGQVQPSRLENKPYLLSRVMNAHYRVGNRENAEAIAGLARRDGLDEADRVKAIQLLQSWAGPQQFDGVTNAWHPMAERDASPARDVVAGGKFHELLQGPSHLVRQVTARLIAQYQIGEAENVLISMMRDPSEKRDTHIEVLRALSAINADQLNEAIAIARESESSKVRLEAIAQLAKLDAGQAVPILAEAMASGTISEKQQAISILANIDHPEAFTTIGNWFDRFRGGAVDSAIQVELIEATRASKDEQLQARIRQYYADLAEGDTIDRYLPALEGGNSNAGRRVFFDKVETSCVRCHVLDGKGGGEVGPDLSGIGARVPRQQILEAIALPSRAIADGYETVMITTTDGIDYTGRVIRQDETEYVLEIPTADAESIDEDPFAEKAHSIVDVIAEDSGTGIVPENEIYVRVSLPKKAVAEVQGGLSSMPEDLVERLTLIELRDLVEFLVGRD